MRRGALATVTDARRPQRAAASARKPIGWRRWIDRCFLIQKWGDQPRATSESWEIDCLRAFDSFRKPSGTHGLLGAKYASTNLPHMDAHTKRRPREASESFM